MVSKHKRKTVALLGGDSHIDIAPEIHEQVRALGRGLASLGLVLATPTSSGFSVWGALGASEMEGTVIGFSPASNAFEHEHHFRLPHDYHTTIIYTGFGILGRDLVLARSVDFAVVVCVGEVSPHEIDVLTQLQKLTLLFIPPTSSFVPPQDIGEFVEVFTSDDALLSRIEQFIHREA